MSVDALLPRSGRTMLGSINALLATLLDVGVVHTLLVPVEMPGGRSVAQALVKDKARLSSAIPVSPVMPVNSATLVSNLTADQRPGKVGVVLRSCEIRALVELVKLKQASLNDVFVIGIDCAGSYSVPDYTSIAATVEGEGKAARVVEESLGDRGFRRDGDELRPACQICEKPSPEFGDLRIGFFGTTPDALAVTVSDELAEAGLERLGLKPGMVEGRTKLVEEIVRGRVVARDQAFEAVRKETNSPAGLLAYFSGCLTCHNCSVTCPICYCKQCVFTTAAFDHTAGQYERRAQRKGAVRMPSDTVLYQITRMNHMATSCVGCGQCESGCPSRIPLTVLYRSIGQKVQALYDYVPGRSLEEEPPVTKFMEMELSQVAK